MLRQAGDLPRVVAPPAAVDGSETERAGLLPTIGLRLEPCSGVACRLLARALPGYRLVPAESALQSYRCKPNHLPKDRKMTTSNASRYTDRLTSENSAMILIDHQTGTMLLGVQDISPIQFRNNAESLAKTAALHRLPAVLSTSAADGPNGPLMKEVSDNLPDAPVIHRQGQISAWDDPSFVAAVEATGRKKLIMAGVTSDVCLMFPALQALAAGYDVYAVIDASGSWSELVEQGVMHRLTQAGAIVTNTAAVVADLLNDWRKPEGEGTQDIFYNAIPYYSFLVNNLQASHASA